MNTTNKRDKARDELMQEWYGGLVPEDKRYVDERVNRVYLAQHRNPQATFSKHNALEVVFSFVLFSVNDKRCARC